MRPLPAVPSCRAALAAVLTVVALAGRLAAADAVEQWGTFELTLAGPAAANPFVDVQLTAVVAQADHRTVATGFYDGQGAYKVRFMPDRTGEWHYVTRSNVPALNDKSGTFICEKPSAGNHGPVRVRNTYHFAYADGTPYFPVGTTSYAWNHQGDALEKQTLATLKQGPFNKLRFCVFPKHYAYNQNEPPLYPFEQKTSGINTEARWDFTRFDPAFFQHLERRIADLRELGVQAD